MSKENYFISKVLQKDIIKKYYILNMFPYPSGEGLHVGHPLGYVASDIYARYKKMKGYKVINPMGFDSFGLPAEQYAILTGQHPSLTTDHNVKHYIDQMKNIDLDFDWNRKFNTSDPEYYKWTQWIFIKMFNNFYCKLDNKAHNIEDLYKYFKKNGTKDIENYVFFKDSKYKFTAEEWSSFDENKRYKISLDYRIAYLDEIEVNWCEGLKTVLANDEVKNGVSERGGYPVVKKKMKQWALRITAYANRLLQGLDYNYSTSVLENFDKEFNKDLKVGLLLEKRKIILAIIKHWSENKYLIIKYKQDNSKAFLTGGIDENESPVDALKREIREETGFVNIRKIKYICRTDCAFHHLRKNKNLMEITYNYYVELKNEENIEIAKEERNILDFEWIEEDKIEDIISYEEHIYPFKILRDKILKLKVFSSELKLNLPIIRRNAILAVIKHWQKDKYLIVNYKKNNQKAFLTGGIEDNEDDEEGLIREIKEESGFIDIKKIIYLCQINSKFYNEIKDINRDLICQCYFVELNSNENIGINDDEKRIQECEWIEENQVENIIDIKEQLYAYRIFKDNFRREIIDWPESTKEMQRNWIGKSQGASIFFEIENESNKIEIFTTRPETIFGVTFIAISKDHVLNTETNENNKTEYFTGKYAIHPFKKNKLPIWVADYVLSDYGTGAIMGVPQLDDRDKDFAKKYGIDVKYIFEDDHFINSDFLNGLNINEGRKEVIKNIINLNIGEVVSTYRLRDAIFSRQRYWGEPIPIYYKEVNIDGNNEKLPFTINEEDLPLRLPNIDDFKPTGEAPLKRAKNWTYKGHELEVNTMPGWAGSSWYFLRYLDTNNNKEFCSKEKLKEFENVDLYLGGAEHAVGHLLYSRFYTKFLYDLGYINFEEPFKKLIHQGMILGESAIIYRNSKNEYVSSDLAFNYEKLIPIHINVNFVDGDNNVDIDKLKKWRPDFLNSKYIYNKDKKFYCNRIIEKMSKSKYNVINPDEIIEHYGSDVFRMYLMFLGPIEQQKPWNTKGIEGIARFLNRVNNITNKVVDKKTDEEELKIINKCIKEVYENIENFSFNTAISSMMICLNSLSDLKNISKDTFKDFLLVLNPFAPKTVKNIWNIVFKENIIKKTLNFIFKRGENNVFNFPEFNEKYLEEDTIQYPIMINGKTRTKVVFNKKASEEKIKNIVLNDEVVKKWILNKEIKKFIIIKDKIISIVI